VLSSGHPLAYVAARQLQFCALHPDFATDCMANGLVPFVFGLLRHSTPPLRMELILLLAELTEYASTRRLLLRNQGPVMKGLGFLVELLTYPTAPTDALEAHADDAPPDAIVKALSHSVWRQERAAIFKILYCCVLKASHVRDLLRNLSFADLMARSPASFAVNVSAAGTSASVSAMLAAGGLLTDRTGRPSTAASRPGTSSILPKPGTAAGGQRPGTALRPGTASDVLGVPLVQILSRPERMLYRTISAIIYSMPVP
jgi:hypothetical protein